MSGQDLELSSPMPVMNHPYQLHSHNINEHTLKKLRTADRFFPVPSVAIAAGVALSIYENLQVKRATHMFSNTYRHWKKLLFHRGERYLFLCLHKVSFFL